jgi:hypothetical protein
LFTIISASVGADTVIASPLKNRTTKVLGDLVAIIRTMLWGLLAAR